MIAYNHELYIKEAILGVLAQATEFDIELIVADDCSNDKTQFVVKEIINNHPQSNVIKYTRHATNRGMIPNFIWAVEQCKGEYIALCEGDDYWTDPCKLQKQVSLFEIYPSASLCVALNERLYNDGRFEKDKKFKGHFSPLIYFQDMGHYFHTSTFLIRTSNINYLLKKYLKLFSGDGALRYLLISQGPIVVLNDYVSVYRITESGVWTSLSVYHKDLIHYKFHKEFRKKFIKEQFKHHLEREIINLKKIIIYEKNNGKILSYLRNKLYLHYLLIRYYPADYVIRTWII